MAVRDRVRGREREDRIVTDGDRRERVVAGVRERQRDEYGGFNIGAAFFGWIIAVGIGALLTALLAAAGTAIAITEITPGEAVDSAETIGLGAGILLLVVAMIAYFAGGYVAGRMSRFDGGRQGLGVWLFSIAIAVLLGILGAIAGSEYNLLGGLDLPRLPIDEGDLTTGGLIFLVVWVGATLLAAIAGGKAGERYHRKVDWAGYPGDRDARGYPAERARRAPREPAAR
jgi:hypothetical protein